MLDRLCARNNNDRIRRERLHRIDRNNVLMRTPAEREKTPNQCHDCVLHAKVIGPSMHELCPEPPITPPNPKEHPA